MGFFALWSVLLALLFILGVRLEREGGEAVALKSGGKNNLQISFIVFRR